MIEMYPGKQQITLNLLINPQKFMGYGFIAAAITAAVALNKMSFFRFRHDMMIRMILREEFHAKNNYKFLKQFRDCLKF